MKSLQLSYLVALLIFSFSFRPQAAAQSAELSETHAVQTAMKNVMYHYTDAVSAHIVRLQGELVPVRTGSIVTFDDKNSFTLALRSAEISIGCVSLAEVLNTNVFSATDAPIKSISIESKNDQLIIKGKLHQKADVPFETTATLSAEPDGRIRLHGDHVKAAHLPVKGLMDLLGIDFARVIDTHKIQGVAVEKDDIILDPTQIFPAPRIQGKVTSVRVQGNDIVLSFGGTPAANFAVRQSGNYMAFRHSEMRFGKLTMHNADLIMIDMDPSDPFDFYLDHYQEQLVAGYSKSTMEYGLRVYTRDFNKLRKTGAAKRSKK